MFSNYPTPDIDYHKLFWISFWGKLEHHKLTAWSVGKSDIIKCNVSSKTGASYGFKAHLENKVFILDPHFVEISRSAFTVTDISVTFTIFLKPSHGNLDLVLLIFFLSVPRILGHGGQIANSFAKKCKWKSIFSSTCSKFSFNSCQTSNDTGVSFPKMTKKLILYPTL